MDRLFGQCNYQIRFKYKIILILNLFKIKQLFLLEKISCISAENQSSYALEFLKIHKKFKHSLKIYKLHINTIKSMQDSTKNK